MSDVSKRFEYLVKSTYKKFAEQGTILPVKTEEGIQVGSALIRSNGSYKDIILNGKVQYEYISLNAVAIRIANELAWGNDRGLCNELYDLDCKYSRYFIDSKIFLDMYHKSQTSEDWKRAEIMWIRYEDVKSRAINTKSRAEELAEF